MDEIKDKNSGSGGKTLHSCELKKMGMMEELDRRAARPTVICNKCQARSDDAGTVCSPRSL